MRSKGRKQMKTTRGSTPALRAIAAIACIAAAVGAATTSANAQALSLLTTNGNIVAYSEAPVPGLPYPDEYFAYTFGNPVIAEDGTVWFQATMEGGSITLANNKALFRA